MPPVRNETAPALGGGTTIVPATADATEAMGPAGNAAPEQAHTVHAWA